jgi:signal transduction histidine kinase
MGRPATIEELKTVIGLSELPDEHLQWLLDHSELREYHDGDMVVKTGGIPEEMIILLEGKVDYYMDVNGTLVFYVRFENDQANGGITGLLPHSRMKVYGGSTFCVGNVRILALNKKHFAELERLNPDFIQRLIGYMTERARTFATIQLQREKVSALGKLSAGIAHELNNPAAAIGRISAELKTRLARNYELTSLLIQNGVSSEQVEQIRNAAKQKETAAPASRSTLERMQAEDDLVDWFISNGFEDNRQAAETFSEFGFSTTDLDQIRQNNSHEAFLELMHWLENLLISGTLIKDLEEASGRISHLVWAIKSHVHMDRMNDAQPTNIHTDIENTLALMGYKLRDKNIAVTRTFVDEIPTIDAYVGELNQVWTNLIDNAIDALDKDGSLTIATSFDPKNVTVRVIDNGSGIPPEIKSRIFDPFFTTKKVGQGTGIGLDTVKRIIDRHHGEIKVESVPGRTMFSVCIPRNQPAGTA